MEAWRGGKQGRAGEGGGVNKLATDAGTRTDAEGRGPGCEGD